MKVTPELCPISKLSGAVASDVGWWVNKDLNWLWRERPWKCGQGMKVFFSVSPNVGREIANCSQANCSKNWQYGLHILPCNQVLVCYTRNCVRMKNNVIITLISDELENNIEKSICRRYTYSGVSNFFIWMKSLSSFRGTKRMQVFSWYFFMAYPMTQRSCAAGFKKKENDIEIK